MLKKMPTVQRISDACYILSIENICEEFIAAVVQLQ